MGLDDRDYSREYGDETPWDRHQREQNRIQKPKSIAIILIVVTVAVFLLDMVSVKDEQSRLAEWFATRHDTLIQPWTWFQFLTYGFLHDQAGLRHLLFNMIALFFFGRAVEQRMGFHEFLRFYLVAIVIGGIAGSVGFWITGEPRGSVIGASGAVLATTILFACYYPHAKILLMFVIPIKAWIVAVIFIVMNIAGAVNITVGDGPSNTAFGVHLSGIAFGLLYYFRKWNLGWLDFTKVTSVRENMRQRSRRMKLKLHDPDKKMREEAKEADRILAKIHQEGEASLTRGERRTLENYSRHQRSKRDS